MARRTSWGSRGGGHGEPGDAERPLSARERVSQRLDPPSPGSDSKRFERALEGLGDVAARRSSDNLSLMLSELREQIRELTHDRSRDDARSPSDLADDIRSLIRELEGSGIGRRRDAERVEAIEALERFRSQIAALSSDRPQAPRAATRRRDLDDLERAVSRISRRQDEIERSHIHEEPPPEAGRLERLGRKLEELRSRPEVGGSERLDGDVRALRGQIAELKDQIDQMGEAYPDLAEAMEDKLEEIARRFSRLDETPDTLLAMERNYREVAEQLSRLADQSEQVGEIRTKLADLRRKIDAAPSADAIRSLEERILELARRLDTLGNRNDRARDERFTHIEEQLSDIARALEPLKATSASSLEAGLAAISKFVAEPEQREPHVLRALDDQIDRLAEGIAGSLMAQKGDSLATIERRLDSLADQIDASARGGDLAPLEDRLHVITEQIDRIGGAGGDGEAQQAFGELLVRLEAVVENLTGQGSNQTFDERVGRLVQAAEALVERGGGTDLSPVLEEIAALRQAVAEPSGAPDGEFRDLLRGVAEQLERLSAAEPVTSSLLDEQVGRILEAVERGSAGPEGGARIERALEAIEAHLAARPPEAGNGARVTPSEPDLAALQDLVGALRDDLATLRTVTESSGKETRETLARVQEALASAAPRADRPDETNSVPRRASQNPDGVPDAGNPSARQASPPSSGAAQVGAGPSGRSSEEPRVSGAGAEPDAPPQAKRPQLAPPPMTEERTRQRADVREGGPRPKDEGAEIRARPSEATQPKGTSAEALRRFAALQAKSGEKNGQQESAETDEPVLDEEPRDNPPPQKRDNPSSDETRRDPQARPARRDDRPAAPQARVEEPAAGARKPRADHPDYDHSGVSLDQPADVPAEGRRRGLLSRLTGRGSEPKKDAAAEPGPARPGVPAARGPAGGEVPADRLQRAAPANPEPASPAGGAAAAGLLESDDPAVQNMLRQMRAAKAPSQSTFLANARRAAQAASIQAMEAERIERETKHPSPIVRAVGKLRSKKAVLLALFLGGTGGMLAVTDRGGPPDIPNLATLFLAGTGLVQHSGRETAEGPAFGDDRVRLLVEGGATSEPPRLVPGLFRPERGSGGRLVAPGRIGPAQTLAVLELPVAIGPPELRDAARSGVAEAQFEVGSRLASNLYAGRNLRAARAWYARAAAAGHPKALFRLGAMYENGTGVETDRKRALELYQKAAGQGHRVAMHNLGVMFASGEGGRADMEASLRWFREAALRGVRDSQFNLGLIYARGLGVRKDPVEAYKWFAIAAQANDQAAAGRRDAIAAKLRRQQLDQARQAVAAFSPLPSEEDSVEDDPAAGWVGANGTDLSPDLSARDTDPRGLGSERRS